MEDNSENTTCCFMFSYQTGATLIGIICCIVFIQNCILAIVHQEAFLYFIANVAFYGIVCFFFLRHRLTMNQMSKLESSREYFFGYMFFIYGFGNIWNLVYWFVMPRHIHNSCEEDQ